MIDNQANKDTQIQILTMENKELQVENKELQVEKKELQARIFKLEKAFSLLEKAFSLLEETNKKYIEENKKYIEENKKYIEEIQELKEKLGLNSTNSSLPPSRDLYKQKKNNRIPSPRKPGGQPGHQSHQYQPMEANQVIDLFPNKCKCGDQIVISDHFTSQQKVEIPPISPYVKEYRRWHGKCRKCGRKVIAPLPQGVSQDMLGPHAKAIISSLNGHFHNSRREVQEILKEVFNLPISVGLINNTAKRVKEKLRKNYQEIEEEIKASSYLHIDETGHKSKGKKGWAWVFTNQEASLIKVSPSRGKKVLVDKLGNYQGYVISDRYGAYNYFEEGQRQICWSHLSRDYQRFAQSLRREVSEEGKKLVNIAREVFCLTKALKSKQIAQLYFLRRIRKLKKKIWGIWKALLRIRDIPQAHRVVRRMQKSFAMMWLFVRKEGIAMTNNLAERQLRKYVIYRKKLLFTWSDWGNQYVERMLSLYLTSRLKKTSAFAQLQLAIGP